jgi:serine/threonine protein phosphatase PrpC
MLRATDTIAKSDTGRQRRDNEDSAFARAPVFVVADGMGGAQAGEVASRIAVEAFQQGLPDSGSPEERLASRAREANRRIHELSQTERERHGMGTTLTAVYLDDATVSIAHVGDSRAYLFRDGVLQRLTKDHTLVGALVDEGKLTEEQAAEHPQRSIITRALGPEPTVEVDTWTYPVRAGDVLLLCSDGLTSMISDDQVTAVMGSTDDLSLAAQRLIAEANAAGGRDNITVVLVRVEDAGDRAVLEQPTIVGAPAVAARPAGSPPAAPPPGSPPAAPPAAPPPRAEPPAAKPPRRGPRLARRQGRQSDTPPASSQTRPERRFVKPVAALIAVVVVLFLVGGGGYLATRQLYFIGTNSQGIVTIFRGLPYDLPAGIHLYESFYVSGVPAAEVPASRRSTLLNHHLRSQGDAQTVVRDLELGRISK